MSAAVAGRDLPPAESCTLSIVIPCWNDAAALSSLLTAIAGLKGIFEVIVADASADETARQLASAARAKVVTCLRPNRGAQMNAGAAVANGNVLLFQHADTELTQRHVDALRAAMQDREVIGGAFHRRFDDRHRNLRWLQPVARGLANRGGTLFGDQSIFVRRDIFEALWGFAEIPLMEDFEFSRKLRKAGRTVVLDPPIASSARHHQHRGAFRTSLRNGAFIVLFRLGFSPQKLHAWYYRGGRVMDASNPGVSTGRTQNQAS